MGAPALLLPHHSHPRSCLETATQEDPSNPESWQGLASFLLVVSLLDLLL